MSTDKITLGQNVMQLDESPKYQPISYVRILAGNDSEGNQIVYEAGDQKSGRTIDVENRLIRDSGQGQLIANNILQAIQGFDYKPFNASGAILDPAAEIGDGVSVGEVYSVLADIETTFSPLMTANISAPEDGDIDHEYPYESSEDRAVIQKMAKMRTSFIVKQGRIATEVSNVSANVDGLSNRVSKVEQTADSITASLSACATTEWVNEELSSKLELTAESITSSVSRTYETKTDATDKLNSAKTYANTQDNAVKSTLRTEIRQTADSIKTTVAKQESKWDLSELPSGVSISSYGYTTPSNATASEYRGKYYLNQNNGRYYYSDGSTWVLQSQRLNLITSNLDSRITQTANSITSVVRSVDNLGNQMSEISQKADSISLSVSSDEWGRSTFTLQNKEAVLDSQTLYLYVDSAHITGTIFANAVQAGATIQSPTIIGGAINGAAFHNAQGSASLELGANSGGYGDMTLYGYNPNSGNKWQVFRVYDNIGSVTFIGYGSTMGTFGSETKTFYAASGTTWDFRDARVLLPE